MASPARISYSRSKSARKTSLRISAGRLPISGLLGSKMLKLAFAFHSLYVASKKRDLFKKRLHKRPFIRREFARSIHGAEAFGFFQKRALEGRKELHDGTNVAFVVIIFFQKRLQHVEPFFGRRGEKAFDIYHSRFGRSFFQRKRESFDART